MVRRGERPAGVGEDGPVVADERKIRLRVPTVDREDDRAAHPVTSASERERSESSASSNDPASSSWPISGWASSALRATTGSRVRAASTASRS